MNEFEPIAYKDGEAALTGLLARPAGKPRAAVAVFPTIYNPTPSVKDKALSLAEHGYLALVCDFYGEEPRDFEHSQELAAALRSDQEAQRERFRAGLRALTSLDDAQGLPALAIGFCMGGMAVLEMARDGADLLAVATFHGILATPQPAEQGAVKARILVCHGDQDPLVPRDHVIAFWEEMDRAGANWHFHSYGGVKHSFTNPATQPGPMSAYDASADRQSWAAMLELFDEELA